MTVKFSANHDSGVLQHFLWFRSYSRKPIECKLLCGSIEDRQLPVSQRETRSGSRCLELTVAADYFTSATNKRLLRQLTTWWVGRHVIENSHVTSFMTLAHIKQVTRKETSAAAAYVQVVLQRLWSGCAAGREAKVVLEGGRVSQQLLHLPAWIRQLTSDGAELGQGDSGCWRRDRKWDSEEVWLRPLQFFHSIFHTCSSNLCDPATWLEPTDPYTQLCHLKTDNSLTHSVIHIGSKVVKEVRFFYNFSVMSDSLANINTWTIHYTVWS